LSYTRAKIKVIRKAWQNW